LPWSHNVEDESPRTKGCIFHSQRMRPILKRTDRGVAALPEAYYFSNGDCVNDPNRGQLLCVEKQAAVNSCTRDMDSPPKP
jgi:hypothetical protein